MVSAPHSHSGTQDPFILSLLQAFEVLFIHPMDAVKMLGLDMEGFNEPGLEVLLIASTQTSLARTLSLVLI